MAGTRSKERDHTRDNHQEVADSSDHRNDQVRSLELPCLDESHELLKSGPEGGDEEVCIVPEGGDQAPGAKTPGTRGRTN
jgi:hypothetical protein